MKTCPYCKKHFGDEVSFCPNDNSVLEEDLHSFVGTTLDEQYQIEDMLGQGGMGAVFRARHILLGDRVAIKIMPTTLSRNPEYQKRFLREGQAARRFQHPNVVAVHDLRKTADGMLYMVLEYIEGNSLNAELKKVKRFSPQEAVELLAPIAEALDKAHSQGVIHRDLKPDNIMVGKDANGRRTVKLLDLGIAKVQDVNSTALTVAGQILGTPHYMSPEQWNGQEIDGRADIYSLAIVFYELISGRRPFEGRTLENLACQHALTVPPPLHEIMKGVPESFSRVIATAMAKDPDKRPNTCLQFLNQMRATVNDNPTLALPNDAENAQTMMAQDNAPSDLYKTKLGNTFLTGQQHPQQETIKFPTNVPQGGNTNANLSTNTTEESRTLLKDPTRLNQENPIAPTTATTVQVAGADKAAYSNNPQGQIPPTTVQPLPQLQQQLQQNYQQQQPQQYKPADPPVKQSSSSSTIIILLAVGFVSLIVVLGGGYIGWKMFVKPASHTPTPIASVTPKTTPTTQPPVTGNEKVEVMKYWLGIAPLSYGDKFIRKADVTALPSGQQFKIYLTSAKTGYIYMLLTGVNNTLTTFITNQPVPDSGLTDNTIKADEIFEFPKGNTTTKDGESARILELDQRAGIEKYSIILSQVPLTEPAFLADQAGKVLTPQEMELWEEFRTTTNRASSAVNLGENPYVAVTIPKEKMDKPISFDIVIGHK